MPDRPPDSLSVPSPVRKGAEWSWRFLAITGALMVIGYLVITLKVIVVPVVIAALLAALLAPVVRVLRDRARLPRWLAALVTLLATLGLVVTLVIVAVGQLINGIADLWDQVVEGFDAMLDWLAEGPLGIDSAQIDSWMHNITSVVQNNSGSIVNGTLSVATSVGQIAAGTVIALFTLFFFLQEGRSIWGWVVRLFPRRARERVDGAGHVAWSAIGSYTRTQILVACVDAIGIGLGALILGLPLVAPLTVLVFLGSFVPFIGAIATGAAAVLVALVDQGVGSALIMLLIVLAVQQIEGNVLQPFMLGPAVRLHPVAVILVVTTGTLVAGIVGALFAVPFAAVINQVIQYLNRTRDDDADPRPNSGPPPSGPEPAVEGPQPPPSDAAPPPTES